MRIWQVAKPEQVKELVRVGALVKGKVLSVEGDRVIIDFGEFVGEGAWEATQPLPKEGDVILVRIMGEEIPIPLRFVKKLKVVEKEVVAEKLPLVEVKTKEFDQEAKKELAGLIKLATKVAEEAVKHEGSREPHTLPKGEGGPIFFAIPFVVEDKLYNTYIAVDAEEEPSSDGLYYIKLFLELPEGSPLRIDMSYAPSAGKRLVVAFITSSKDDRLLFEGTKKELEEKLKAYGFLPVISVVDNPSLLKKELLLSRSSVLERRA